MKSGCYLKRLLLVCCHCPEALLLEYSCDTPKTSANVAVSNTGQDFEVQCTAHDPAVNNSSTDTDTRFSLYSYR